MDWQDKRIDLSVSIVSSMTKSLCGFIHNA